MEMDNSEAPKEVSLPSASTEHQTILEQQNSSTLSQNREPNKKNDNILRVIKDNGEEESEESELSESDNEEINDVIEVKVIAKESNNVNVNDEFEKVVPYKFEQLSEECVDDSVDETDREIEEILNLKTVITSVTADIVNVPEKSEEIVATDNVEEDFEVIEIVEPDTIVSSESLATVKEVNFENQSPSAETLQETTINEVIESIQLDTIVSSELLPTVEEVCVESQTLPAVVPKEVCVESQTLPAVVPKETIIDDIDYTVSEQTQKETIIDDVNKHRETIIDEELLPKEILLALQTNIDDHNDPSKPPVPIQTYMWEDVKRSKEQGAYPWTHLTKGPLGADEEPEVILKYKYSPRSIRKSENRDLGTPKAQKKVRIQEEIEFEADKSAQEYSDNEEPDNDVNADCEDDEDETEIIETEITKDLIVENKEETKEESKEGILKRSQKFLDSLKPNTSKFDSGSLRRKINNPLNKIKKMADKQFKKVKPKKNAIKSVSIDKDDILLAEETKILKLKESPKTRNRELTSYVVKQDSDETLDIQTLDESPSETRKRRESLNFDVIVPDEIIELPIKQEMCTNQLDNPETASEESQEPTIDEILIEEMKNDPPSKASRKPKEHVYEDIDEYISKITSDGEHVERSPYHHENLQRQFEIDQNDPIFDEFSREGNRSIRKSLSMQDEKMRHELARKVPKIEELAKQISDEDREEKIEDQNVLTVKQHYLLAPISSIDSTSSDEDRRAQLSIVNEDSENSGDSSSKKKSFDESSVDNKDIESLDEDGSEISVTLIERELKGFDEKLNLDFNDYRMGSTEIPPEVMKEDVEVKKDENTDVKVSERWSKMTDHEYEPIGEPIQQYINDPMDYTEDEGAVGGVDESRLLKLPTLNNEDNISAQDFQDDIESRFFSNKIEHIADNKENVVHQENIADEAVIIDESPVKRDVPQGKKRNIILSAQESGKSLQKKIKAQAGMLKSSINNKMKRKPKETPVAVEVASVEEPSIEEEIVETALDKFTVQEVKEVQEVQEVRQVVNPTETTPKPKRSIKMPKMSRPDFTKNIGKPSLPKFKKPQFKKPELPKMPDMKMGEKFSNLRKLGRSKSMKEPSVNTTDTTSFATTPEDEPMTSQPTKKRFDFGTYPRLIKDKFKRSKTTDRSDRSVRADTPPIMEFTKVSKTALNRGPVASRWHDHDEESGKYKQFDSETELERESSIERRMRLDYERNLEEEEQFEDARRLISEEQRQLEEMDRENQEIHQMAKQEKQRKQYIKRQESDVNSEDDKMLWSGTLNKDAKLDFEDEPNALALGDEYKYNIDDYTTGEINRSTTPQTNQETQSSGSSGTRRRRGVLEEVDDDEYFSRDRGILNENIRLGDYISSAIKEGLSSPEDNALAHMGEFDDYYHDDEEEQEVPEAPMRSLKSRKNKKSRGETEEFANEMAERERQYDEEAKNTDFYKTFPPHRPTRKQKKGYQDDDEEDEEDVDIDEVSREVPYNITELVQEMSNNQMFYHQQVSKEPQHSEMLHHEDIEHQEFMRTNLPVPPTPPRRRKKKVRGMPVKNAENFFDADQQNAPPIPRKLNKDVIVYRTEQEFVPLAQEEHFTTPTTTPRRTRSRSQISSYTLDDADSFRNDSIEVIAINNGQFSIQGDGMNGYAIIKKDLPPRPPAPVRRKRSTKSLGERNFATMPHKRTDQEAPPRPVRNYSTISPSRPPRRKSATSLVEIGRIPCDYEEDDDYEEIRDKTNENDQTKRLHSGDIINKMKDRPLPPPPRPKRDNKKHKRNDDTDDTDKHDRDDGAEKVMMFNEEPITSTYIEELNVMGVPSDRLPRQDSEFSEGERVVEVEVSTQTDPVIDEDFICDYEEEDVDIDDYIRDGKMKTLEEILKEEQEAELERARQLAEAENLSRGIQRFRDSNQRSFSERSRTSGDRSKSLSRPITPCAVLVERKKSSPIIFNNEQETLTEASLFVHPISFDNYGREPSEHEDDQQQMENTNENLDYNNNLERNAEDNLEARGVQFENNLISDVQIELNSDEDDAEMIEIDSEVIDIDSEMFDEVDKMVESIMNTAQERVEEIRISLQEIEDEDAMEEQLPLLEEKLAEILLALEETPIPPPRRRSTYDDTTEATPQTPQIDIPAEIPEELIEPEEVPVIEASLSNSEIESHLQSNRLHLSNLEIDNLSVCSLQAGRITVSELDSNKIKTNELECNAEKYTSHSIEFPPGFIEEIVERVRSVERETSNQNSQPSNNQQTQENVEKKEGSTIEQPPRPPLPQQFMFSPDYPGFSVIPPSFYQLRNYSDEDATSPPRRRRHQQRRKDSTSEEEYQKEQKNKSSHTSHNRSPEPSTSSVASLGGQLARACGNALKGSGSELMAILRASSKDENKRDLHIALIILIVIVAGLILVGMGEKSIHHHHWDYFNPPDNYNN